MHPAAQFILRGLGRVATKAVDHATASVAEDIRDFASEIGQRAQRVIDRARCRCTCAKCYIAREHRTEHCEECTKERSI